MSYTATGYYIDPNGRRGEFEVESPSSDRRQIERIVRNRYDADKVQINSVGLTPDPNAERRERERREQERYDRERAEERLEQSSYSSSSSSSSSYSAPRRSSSNPEMDSCLGTLALYGVGAALAFWFLPYVLGGFLGYHGAKAGKKDGFKMALMCSVILGGGGFIVGDVVNRVTGTGAHYVPTEQPAAAPAAKPAPSAPAAPSQPAPVVVPNRSARPVYARTEPPVTPVWEMEEDLTGNPDFTFND